jgi:hypothetical protein
VPVGEDAFSTRLPFTKVPCCSLDLNPEAILCGLNEQASARKFLRGSQREPVCLSQGTAANSSLMGPATVGVFKFSNRVAFPW